MSPGTPETLREVLRLCAAPLEGFFNRFDFGMRIGPVEKVVTFYYCFHKYQLGEDAQSFDPAYLTLH